MLVAARDVDSRLVFVGILNALELHAQVLVVVALHGDAVGLHPVHDQLRQLHAPGTYVSQVLPHLHDKEVVDGFSNSFLSVLGDVVEHLRLLRLATHQADGQFSILLRLWRHTGRALPGEMADDVVQVGRGWELAWATEMVLTPLTLIQRKFDVNLYMAHR